MTVWLAPDRAPTAGPPAARQAALRPGLRRRSRSGAAGRLLRGGDMPAGRVWAEPGRP